MRHALVRRPREPGKVKLDTLTLTTHGAQPVSKTDTEAAWLRVSTDGIEYWLRADDSGIYRVASKVLPEATPKLDATRRYVLKAPFTVGTQWQTTTTAYLLTRRPAELHRNYPGVPITYRIDAVDQAIETPAGRYAHCARVRGSATISVFVDPMNNWRDAPLTTLEWYCRGVGLVRMERNEPLPTGYKMMVGGTRTFELLSFR